MKAGAHILAVEGPPADVREARQLREREKERETEGGEGDMNKESGEST